MESQYQEYSHSNHHHPNHYNALQPPQHAGRPIVPQKPKSVMPTTLHQCDSFPANGHTRMHKSGSHEWLSAGVGASNGGEANGHPHHHNQRRLSFVADNDYLPIPMDDGYSAPVAHPSNHNHPSNRMSQSTSSSHYSAAGGHISDGRTTLTRRAQKIAQKAQKLTIATISSELSSSASALYALFTPENGNGGGGTQYSGGTPSSAGHSDDRTDEVSAHINKGIEFLEKYAQYVKDRSTIEEEYALKLRNLAKKNRGKKSEEDECKIYSYMGAFYSTLDELNSLAAQSEVIGERLKKEVAPAVVEKCQALRIARKKYQQDFNAHNHFLQTQADNMLKLQKQYVKAFRDAEYAHLKHDKIDKNKALSRLDVERAKTNVIQKSQVCEQAKQSYAHGLELANHAQYEHYKVKLPALLEEMRKLDIDRIAFTKAVMLQGVEAETGVMNIRKRCYDDMNAAIAKVDAERDTVVVVEQNKSGYAHPPDHMFVDLGCPSTVLLQIQQQQEDGGGGGGGGDATLKRSNGHGHALPPQHLPPPGKNTNGKAIPRKSSMHQRLFGGGGGSGGGGNGSGGGKQAGGASNSANDHYGNLPPQQRCRHLQNKLAELNKELATKEQSRAAMERMFHVYSENPKLGNAATIEQQMGQFGGEMAALQDTIEQFNRLLMSAQAELNAASGGGSSYPSSSSASSPRTSLTAAAVVGVIGGGGGNINRTSYSGESSCSEGSTVPQRYNGGGVGGLNGFPTAAVKEPHPMQHIDSNAEVYEECDAPNGAAGVAAGDLPILGSCTALFPYEGDTEGSISMHEGDEMLLVERDEGDGWTRVRHPSTQLEGFVPTSYLRCRFYPSS